MHSRALAWCLGCILGLMGLDYHGREREPLLIDAEPAQYVDNCGRFHSGPGLMAPDPDPTFPGSVQPSKDKGVA